jgi:hypothetical protein
MALCSVKTQGQLYLYLLEEICGSGFNSSLGTQLVELILIKYVCVVKWEILF